MVTYGAQVYNQETVQDALQSGYDSYAPYGTVHDHFIAIGQTWPVNMSLLYTLHACLLADRIQDQIYISHNLPTISI